MEAILFKFKTIEEIKQVYKSKGIKILDNELKLLIYQGTGLSCLNPSDGKSLWTAPWPTEYGVNATTPIVSNDIIFHTSGYKMGCEAIKVTKSGYTVLWKNNLMEAQHSDPILIDGYIYGYSGESSRNNGQFKLSLH